MSARSRRRLALLWVALFVFSLVLQVAALAVPDPTLGESLSVDLDQYANGGKTSAAGWQNGDLNGNGSRYAEGEVVPFRLAVEGLTAGQHTIHLEYDFTAGGHEAYDFLASYDATESPAICATGGGGVSSLCPVGGADSAVAFPTDPFAIDGTTVSGAEAEAGVERQLRMWGGTIDHITTPVHAGSVSGNSTGDITVTFTTSGTAALFAWGGHLAQSAYWLPGDPNGAGQISGASWHMRTQQLDDSANKNQDRSIQPSAIAKPDLAITKTADGAVVSAGDAIGFTITVTNNGDWTANDVTLSDPLPAGVDWSIADSNGSPSCSIAGSPPSESLGCTKATLASGASFSVHVTSATTNAACGVHDNTATAAADGVAPITASASITVDCAVVNLVKTADATDVAAGGQIGFTLTATNNGAGTAYGLTVSDPLPTNAGLAWTIDEAGSDSGWSISAGQLGYGPADLAAGASVTVHIVSPTTRASCGAVDNSGTVTTTNDGSDTASASLTVRCPALTIAKTFTGNSLPPVTGTDVQQAAPGDTLTYTLAYTLTSGPVTDGVITDVLPAGQTYVDGSASDNAEFTFESYDSATRTLTWTAPTVTADGTVTYQVTIDADGSDVPQPLTNTARIASAETDPATAAAAVVVPAGAVEALTPPPTDVRPPRGRPASPGFSLMLILLGLAGFALVLGTITPVPERIRRRERDS